MDKKSKQAIVLISIVATLAILVNVGLLILSGFIMFWNISVLYAGEATGWNVVYLLAAILYVVWSIALMFTQNKSKT